MVIRSFFIFLIAIAFINLYYLTRIKDNNEDRIDYSSALVNLTLRNIIVSSGALLLPIFIFLFSDYFFFLLKGEHEVRWMYGVQTFHYENEDSAFIFTSILQAGFFALFFWFYDTKELSKLTLWIQISFYVGLVLFNMTYLFSPTLH